MASDAGANAPPASPAGEPSEGSAQRTDRKRGRRFRWLVGFLTTAAAIAGLAYFVVSFAPDYIARYLVRTYFEGLAIDTSGVETIDIEPAAGRQSGSARCRSGAAKARPDRSGRSRFVSMSAVCSAGKRSSRPRSTGSASMSARPLTVRSASMASRLSRSWRKRQRRRRPHPNRHRTLG